MPLSGLPRTTRASAAEGLPKTGWRMSMAFVRLAFFAGGTARQRAGWQVMQLWDTREDLERFNDDVHLPAVARLGGTDFPQAPSCAVSTPSTSGSAMRSCAEQLRAALQCRVRRVSAHISVQLSARP